MGRRQFGEKNPSDQLEYCLLKKRRRTGYKESIPCKQSLTGEMGLEIPCERKFKMEGCDEAEDKAEDGGWFTKIPRGGA